MIKDEEKRKALQEYEEKVKQACAIRSKAIEMAKTTCAKTIDEAHKDFRRIVDGLRQTAN